MSSSTTLDTSPSCKESYGCNAAPYKNTQYCVLHLPQADKIADFEEALKKKLRNLDFDFRGVWFPAKADFRGFSFTTEANFQGATFTGKANFQVTIFEQPVTFNKATFKQHVNFGAKFSQKADFSQVSFKEFADFTRVNFEKESIFFEARFFSRTKFENATFNRATTFEKASFGGTANFNSANFGEAANFGSVIFDENVTFDLATLVGEASFHNTTFKKRVDFETTFKGKVHFSQTEFGGRAEFTRVCFERGANFFAAKFSSIASFEYAQFRQRTTFDEATFRERVSFKSVAFGEVVNFREGSFEDRVIFDGVVFTGEASFHLAIFKDSVRFKGDKVFSTNSPPNFRETKFNKPKLVAFHSVTLRPHWFFEVDASEFALENVNWNWGSVNRKWAKNTIEKEINEINKHYEGLSSRDEAFALLCIACWNLAVNAEDNHRYEEASKFRYLAMESRRLAIIQEMDSSVSKEIASNMLTRHVRQVLRYLRSRLTLPGIYRVLSGYGEEIKRASIVLIGIWAMFGIGYSLIPVDHTGALGWSGFPYSALVITLQRPEPRPTVPIAQALVALEVILGPVQAALLALAIRRKFMR
jgi:Pentapeptide repeats (9 copies)